MTNVAVGGQRAASYMLYTSCSTSFDAVDRDDELDTGLAARKKIDPEDLVSKIAAATGTGLLCPFVHQL